MAASIRGHQGTIKLMKDGGDADVLTITSFDVQAESSFQRSYFVGQRYPEGDQTIDGYSGTIELEVKGPEVEEMIDALVDANLEGIGVSDYTMVLVENYGDGRSKSHVYFDIQFRYSKRQSGLNEKVTKRLEFQCAGRLPLS